VLTVREVAELLSLDPYTVRDKARKGEIPGVQLGSGPKAQWRFSRKRIMELIEGRGGQV
jgi:excisionase family DNA binding protein